MKHRTIATSLREKNLNNIKKKKKELHHDLISGRLHQAQLKPNYFYFKADYQHFKEFLIFRLLQLQASINAQLYLDHSLSLKDLPPRKKLDPIQLTKTLTTGFHLVIFQVANKPGNNKKERFKCMKEEI